MPARRWPHRSLALAIAMAAITGACNGGGRSRASCGIEGGGRCRPQSERVDRAKPSFAKPTAVTNPLVPAGQVAQALQLGTEGNEKARTEITRLPRTKAIAWNGVTVDALVLQVVSFGGRRIDEVTLDYVAQADDGSVWYMGESVSNYKGGVVVDHEGSWLAGQDGPAGMLMPAHPRVGDVFRPENIPGLVFEEDTVTATGATIDGPRGPVGGAVVVREHLMENAFEEKAYAPGYGETRIRAGDERADLALAVPPDAAPGPLPAELQALSAGAGDVFEMARAGDWTGATSGAEGMSDAWDRYRSGGAPPALLASELSDALGALTHAVDDHDRGRAVQAAVDAAMAALDIPLRYRPVTVVDVGRMDAWARQVLVDGDAGDRAAVVGDVATLEVVRDRVVGGLDPGGAAALEAGLRPLRVAADRGDVGGVVDGAVKLRAVLAGLTVRG